MFKKPQPFQLNGIAELLRQAEDSKTLRTHVTKELVQLLEEQRRRQRDAELKEYVTRGQRNGAL